MHGRRCWDDFGAWGDFSQGNFHHPNYHIILIYISPPWIQMNAVNHGVQCRLCDLVCAGEDDVQWETSAPRQTSLPVVSHLAVAF